MGWGSRRIESSGAASEVSVPSGFTGCRLVYEPPPRLAGGQVLPAAELEQRWLSW